MRIFVKKIIAFFAPLAFLWVVFVVYCSFCTGDLGREGFIPFGRYEYSEKKSEGSNLIECFSVDSLKNAEVITVGDSFSRQLHKGWNSFMSDSLHCKVYNFRVRNRGTHFNYLYLIDSLAQIGKLEKCRFLVVESCEKFLIQRLLELEKPILPGWEESPQDIKRTNRDFKKCFSPVYMRSFGRILLGIDKPVNQYGLDACYFSHSIGSTVFCLDSDIRFAGYSQLDYEKAMFNLSNFSASIKASGINLLFLVCADKYDMYYEQIVDEGCVRNPTFDYLNELDSVFVINSKSVLKPYVESRTKDIYLMNDSHWSTIAAQKIGWEVADIILNSDR